MYINIRYRNRHGIISSLMSFRLLNSDWMLPTGMWPVYKEYRPPKPKYKIKITIAGNKGYTVFDTRVAAAKAVHVSPSTIRSRLRDNAGIMLKGWCVELLADNEVVVSSLIPRINERMRCRAMNDKARGVMPRIPNVDKVRRTVARRNSLLKRINKQVKQNM